MSNLKKSCLLSVTKLDGAEFGYFSILNPPDNLIASLIDFWKAFDSDEEVRDKVFSLYEDYVSVISSCWLSNDINSLWEPGLRSVDPVIFNHSVPGGEMQRVSVQILGLNIEDEVKASDDKIYAEFYDKFIEIIKSYPNYESNN